MSAPAEARRTADLREATRRELERRAAVGELPAALSVKDFAALMNTSVDAAYEAIAAGRFPFPVLRIGRVIRIPRAAVLESLGLAGADCGHKCGQREEAPPCA